MSYVRILFASATLVCAVLIADAAYCQRIVCGPDGCYQVTPQATIFRAPARYAPASSYPMTSSFGSAGGFGSAGATNYGSTGGVAGVYRQKTTYRAYGPTTTRTRRSILMRPAMRRSYRVNNNW